MNFLHNNLGHRNRGEVVEITLTKGANVRLMDNSNFNSYKNGRNHRYTGGLAKKTPVRLQIPRTGNWHVAIDMQGLKGSTRASVKMIPGMQPLPAIQDRPLSEIPSLVRDNLPPKTTDGGETYDVFISHASEDKDEFVRPLANALMELGMKVWFDEMTLKIGDSLRQKIDNCLLYTSDAADE